MRNLGFCEPTSARRISYQESLVCEKFHEQSSRAFGFDLIDIPAGDLADRVAAVSSVISPPPSVGCWFDIRCIRGILAVLYWLPGRGRRAQTSFLGPPETPFLRRLKLRELVLQPSRHPIYVAAKMTCTPEELVHRWEILP
ncbi:hypothetical protein AB0D34_39810 [Streptomyces sp. NPDC048420]|uniref:hypothetical protein n=1 Tax=Streptomyces sp. NPDC048420 TaxID=3155755 RepID=UPI003428CF68